MAEKTALGNATSRRAYVGAWTHGGKRAAIRNLRSHPSSRKK